MEFLNPCPIGKETPRESTPLRVKDEAKERERERERASCPAEEHVREEQRAHSQPKTRSPQLTVWRTLDGATVLESQMILGLYQIYDRFHTAQSINKIAKITHKNYS